ncbi:hypothetical protein ACHQM5_028344 [Ranunculus cassubicifolius]
MKKKLHIRREERDDHRRDKKDGAQGPMIQEYKAMYSEELIKCLTSELSGDVEVYTNDHDIVICSFSCTRRYEGYEVDRMAAESDAKTLYKAGEKRLGTDEKTFNIIFSSRSSAHMAAVSASYYQMHGNSLEKKETSGAYEFALLTILRCAESAPKYFAKALHKAMKGMGTNDSALIRIVVTRTEIDMQYIKLEYQKKYKKTLYDAIKSETSGNYRNFLLSLVGAH